MTKIVRKMIQISRFIDQLRKYSRSDARRLDRSLAKIVAPRKPRIWA